jgi:hypothetical protein
VSADGGVKVPSGRDTRPFVHHAFIFGATRRLDDLACRRRSKTLDEQRRLARFQKGGVRTLIRTVAEADEPEKRQQGTKDHEPDSDHSDGSH